MEGIRRKPFQGVTNIIKFNWHFYVIAVIVAIISIFCNRFLVSVFHFVNKIFITLGITSVIISLLVSWYVYDYYNLYSLSWLDQINIVSGKKIININAGFDETSAIIAQKYKPSNLTVLDFFDPILHTEISIARARKIYAAYPVLSQWMQTSFHYNLITQIIFSLSFRLMRLGIDLSGYYSLSS